MREIIQLILIADRANCTLKTLAILYKDQLYNNIDR